MRFRFFTVPAWDAAAAEADLNRFLSSHRVVAIDRQLIHDGPRAAWAIAVEYLDGQAPASASAGGGASIRNKIDYRHVLSEGDFAVFAKLREVRKQLADADERPVFAVANNEQLAAIATARTSTLQALATIEGFGKSRIERYGEALLKVVRAAASAEPGASAPPKPTAREEVGGGG